MSDEAPQTVPLTRLNSEIEARKKETAARKEAEAEVARLTAIAGTVEALTAQRDEAISGRRDDAAKFEAREAFVRVGFDPSPDADADAMEVIRARWERLPPKERGTLHEWLTGDAKKDRIASALLPKAEAPPAPEGDPAPPADPGPPQPRATHTNAGRQPTPPAGAPMSREVYQKRVAAARTSGEVRQAMADYGLIDNGGGGA